MQVFQNPFLRLPSASTDPTHKEILCVTDQSLINQSKIYKPQYLPTYKTFSKSPTQAIVFLPLPPFDRILTLFQSHQEGLKGAVETNQQHLRRAHTVHQQQLKLRTPSDHQIATRT